ncbi:formylglycine-generating enzyme family protein [Lutimonas sp.]|uniref:formylglycine-generating enzyme family protein n=1 Tax=Lutimonas sp. TaxID=1872403 RepID=UPI003D9BDEC6
MHAQQSQENYTQSIKGSGLNLELIFIESGSYKMGSNKTSWGVQETELPEHDVEVSAFWMSEVEITWDLYNLFVNRKMDAQQASLVRGSEVDIMVDAVTGATIPYVDMSFGMGVQGYPAICMTQLAASRFCQWLSAMTGYFYRLPTEAEWEYACRAGSETAYSFGDDLSELPKYAWFSGNSEGKTQKVRQLQPNDWGLYDMHGNVAEWTLDQFNPEGYKQRQGTVEDPLVLAEKTYPKSVRGGSWQDDPMALRSASRLPSSKRWKMRDPQIPKSLWWHTDAPFVGFRIVRPLKTPSEEEQQKYWRIKSNETNE